MSFSVVVLTTVISIIYGVINISGQVVSSVGLMYPRASETRDVRPLDGVWNFGMSHTDNSSEGLVEQWYLRDLRESTNVINMPVPSSYNDISTEQEIRDHIGTVWYDRTFFVPRSWQGERVWIRFGSVHYESAVWINGILAVQHVLGHLPFEAEITEHIEYGEENRVTVLCDNVLTQITVPQGEIRQMETDNGMQTQQVYSFDFFNYAGIHRSVHLYTTPQTFIQEIVLNTDIDADGHGHVHFRIINSDNDASHYANIFIYDKDKHMVATQLVDGSMTGEAIITNVSKWWPYLMHSEPAYLYTFEVKLSTPLIDNVDVYRLKFGVRTLKWTNTSFLINDQPIYFRGFGRHEDSDVRGKGLDMPLLIRDFNLIRWMGANAYRTSHYPYSEESMDLADEYGIMIIDECPSVNVLNPALWAYAIKFLFPAWNKHFTINRNFSEELLNNHKRSIEKMIHRDRNHPSVVMWSIANEPNSHYGGSTAYFREITEFTRSIDTSHPITAAIHVNEVEDNLGQFCDIISFNDYNAWYINTGRLDMITNRVVAKAERWHAMHNKPVLMSEYGADTLEGLHILPSFVWTEEFQIELFSRHFEAFDRLRSTGYFIGEFVWNFQDFKTGQSYTRVGGNKKGIFTRNRQPKASAHYMRKRYFALADEIDGLKDQPRDLYNYVHVTQKILRDEL